jgi:hypothetical protein
VPQCARQRDRKPEHGSRQTLLRSLLRLPVPSSLSTCPSDPPHPSMVRGRRPYSLCLAVALFENFFSSIRPRAPKAGSVKVARLSFLPTIFPGLSASLCQWTSYHSSVLFTLVRPSVLYSCGGEPTRSMARSVCNRSDHVHGEKDGRYRPSQPSEPSACIQSGRVLALLLTSLSADLVIPLIMVFLVL